jgi:2'-5' RNA ligase
MGHHPVVSVELLLDEATEAIVRAEWEALAGAGLSSMARHTDPSNRPHVTLLVRPELPAIDADRLVARRGFAVTLGAPMLFGAGDRRVLVRSVVPNVELLALHRDVHAAAGPGDDAAHTVAGDWMPHVTLARRMRTQDLEAALGCIDGDLHGRADALRRWDAATATVTDLGRFASD